MLSRLSKRKATITFLTACVLAAVLGVIPVSASSEGRATPQETVETALNAYQKQKNDTLDACYTGKSNLELSFKKNFFLAAESEKIDIKGTEILFKYKGFTYVGVRFCFITGDGDRIPHYERFLVKETSKNSYQIVPEDTYSKTVSSYIRRNKTDIENARLYQSYLEDERSYARKNPTYADEIYGRLKLYLKDPFYLLKKELRMLGMVLAVAIIQLAAVNFLSLAVRRAGKKRRKEKPLL